MGFAKAHDVELLPVPRPRCRAWSPRTATRWRCGCRSATAKPDTGLRDPALGRPPGHNVQVILEHALLPVKAGQEDDFESAFGQAKSIIAGMPGFGQLTLSRCIERPGTYLLLVQWDRLEDHTQGFRESEQYQDWRRLLHHFYEPFPTVEHYQLVDTQESPGTAVDHAQSLAEIRASIDGVDHELVQLISDRERLVRQAGRLKSNADAVRAPDRVEAVIARVRAMADELGASPMVVERTYRSLITAFVELELSLHHAATSDERPAH